MKVLALRKKLSEYINTADNKIITALYTLLENDIEENKRIGIEQITRN